MRLSAISLRCYYYFCCCSCQEGRKGFNIPTNVIKITVLFFRVVSYKYKLYNQIDGVCVRVCSSIFFLSFNFILFHSFVILESEKCVGYVVRHTSWVKFKVSLRANTVVVALVVVVVAFFCIHFYI